MRPRGVGVTLPVAVAVLITVLVPTAGAGIASDPRDARGSRLDFKRLESSWTRGEGVVEYDFKAVMWQRWGRRDLECFPCGILFRIDTRGGRRADVVVSIVSRDGEVVADLYRLRPRRFVATLGVAKGPRYVRMWIPKKLLRPERRMRWQAWSIQGGVDDTAPNRGWLWVK